MTNFRTQTLLLLLLPALPTPVVAAEPCRDNVKAQGLPLVNRQYSTQLEVSDSNYSRLYTRIHDAVMSGGYEVVSEDRNAGRLIVQFPTLNNRSRKFPLNVALDRIGESERYLLRLEFRLAAWMFGRQSDATTEFCRIAHAVNAS